MLVARWGVTGHNAPVPRRPKIGPLPNAPPRPIVIPEWARDVRAARSDFDEVLDLASFELGAVLAEPYESVFSELSRAARSEWSRLGETTDDALLVAYQLVRLAPGMLECLEEPEYGWLVTPLAAISGRETDFERRVRKKAGAPRRGDGVPFLYATLRSWGYRYAEAVRGVALTVRLTNAAVEQNLKRSSTSTGRVKAPCYCHAPYPYCVSCGVWLSDDPAELQRQLGARLAGGQLVPRHSLCASVFEMRPVEETFPVCHSDGSRMILLRGWPVEVRCPRCDGEKWKPVTRLLGHVHCVICRRPHAMNGPPVFVQVGPGEWACNDLGDDTGCLARARSGDRDSGNTTGRGER